MARSRSLWSVLQISSSHTYIYTHILIDQHFIYQRIVNYTKEKMYLTRSEYDRGVNTFSPEGRLFQVEYAIEAVKLGSTAVGIQTKHGVILASEKRLTSSLLEPVSIEKIMEIDAHIGAAVSGLTGDARTLIDHARVEAQNHTFTFDEVRLLP